MSSLEKFFEIKLTNDMEAVLILNEMLPEGELVTKEGILQFSKDQGIVYGVNEEAISQLLDGLTMKVILAVGKQPVDGEDAYLQPFFEEGRSKQNDPAKAINLKEIQSIPTVCAGEKVATKVAASLGEPGINVFGKSVEAKPGKDFKLRKGKNTRLKESEQTLYSLIDGQVSIEKHTIHVLPTYEVNGDLNLRTGNISFVGNVNVKGNVPSGFEIEAGGDIRVTGTVEGAKLTAEGSIFIGAGIVGQNKSFVFAKGNLKTTFINEGHVDVGGDIEVGQTIHHSTCISGGKIVCTSGKGLIVGGAISAIESIQVNEIGNEMHTKTELFIGIHEKAVQQQKKFNEDLKKAQDDFMKSAKLLKTYIEKEKQDGPLVGHEKLMKLKIQHSFQSAKQTIDELSDCLSKYKEQESFEGFILAEKVIYPNATVHFGKYSRKIGTLHREAHISLINSEIVIAIK
ncbi:DUF342 domain-containing protein [bacterium LRH843]|nr:DUF342 domain-containing protein [bacterium LRH843]